MSLKGVDELEDDNEISLQDILMDLQNAEKDLELKTEINNPKDLAGLFLLSVVCKMSKFPSSSKLIKDYITIYLKYMVSNKRKSRIELVKAIAGILDRDTKKLNVSEKMTTNMK